MKNSPSASIVVTTIICTFLMTAVAFAQAPGPQAPGPQAPGPSAPWPPAAPENAYVEGEVIVKLKKGTGPSQAAAIAAELSASVAKRFQSIGAELWQLRGVSVEEAIARYKNDPRIEYIEPNFIYRAMDTIPNDPRFDELWGMHNTGQTGGVPDVDIDAPEAWDIATGDTTVLVGVIDTGVDYTHEDLADNMWTNPGEIPNNGVDDDGNGYVDDYRGWDFAYNDNDPMDVYGHGTHVSGTIGGVGNNGIGVTGVCWKVRIVPIKFLDDSGYGTTANAVLSVEYGTKIGVNLTNNSWGGGAYSLALKDAIAAADSAGILFVASSGNGYRDTDVSPSYPASYDNDNIISVANIMHDDQLRPSSNWGLITVDLAAPGSDVLSCLPNDRYALKSGTSMSSPHVAGAVALLWSVAPTLTHDEAKAIVLSSVVQTPFLIGKIGTGGRLNIFNMLSGLDSIPPAPVNDLAVVTTGSNTVTLTWTASGDDSTDGTARRNDIRFSTSPITAANFDAATPFTGVPSPLPSGETESVRLHGLDVLTSYYFAMKALDEQANASPMSNVVSGTTLGVPQLVFAPDSLSDNLLTGGKSTHVITIKNTGEGTLDFWLPDLDEPEAGAARSPGQEAAISWMRAFPNEGEVFAGDSAEVEISLDATGLLGGVYTANPRLTTNDPARVVESIFVHMTVTNAPDIVVSPASLDFGKHFQNATVLDSVLISNFGYSPLIVSGVSSSHGDFSADPSGFMLTPGLSRYLVVTFNPSTIGVMSGTLTITSDDPDTPVMTVSLAGEGVVPPEISIAPSLLVDALSTGETADHTLTITNSGGADLDWGIVFKDSANSTVNTYTLTVPPLDATPVEKEPQPAQPRAQRSEPLIAQLQDLQGTEIMWDRAHGQSSSQSWSTLVSDLTARGATVTENHSVVSPSLLSGYDIVWTIDSWSGWTAQEIAALRNWISGGGGLLIESDQATTIYNEILEGTGIEYIASSATGGTSPNVYAHEVTRDVTAVWLGGPLARFSSVDAPAVKLVDDLSSRPTGAAGLFGTGRIVVFSDEVFDDYDIISADNQLLGNQVFGWLANAVSWLSTDITSGTLPGFSSQEVTVTFNATGLEGNTYEADIVVESNDPDDPEVSSHAMLVVTSAPDINVSSTAIDFGDVFVSSSAQATLFVLNDGVENLQVSHILSDDPDFSVDATSMVVPPGDFRTLTVTYAPASDGAASATLSIVSNDPDEDVVEISVTGRGLLPPVIQVDPPSFITNLVPGAKSDHTLTIENTGVSDLEWNLEIRKSGAGGGLAGLKILFDRFHGQQDFHPEFIAAIKDEGGTITESSALITRDLLDGYDILLLLDYQSEMADSELVAIIDWVADGGNIFVQIDEYPAMYSVNSIAGALGAGFYYSSMSSPPGLATDILAHKITANVDSLYLPGPQARITVSGSPAAELVRHSNGFTMTVCSDLGKGRIFAASDEYYASQSINAPGSDNLTFLLQALQWTAGGGAHWLDVSPTSGTTASGVADEVTVTFDATGMVAGVYQGDVIVNNNDPNLPVVTIPTVLGVTSAPDIELSADLLDFGVVFTTVTAKETLLVYNAGTEPLVLGQLTVTGTGFSATVSSGQLFPGQSAELYVNFRPQSEGPQLSKLGIPSNDPDEPVFYVHLTGVGLDPPEIVVSPDSLIETLVTGATAEQPVYISNVGASVLNWSVAVDQIDSSGTRVYELATPPVDAVPADRNQPETRKRSVRSAPLIAQLSDLTGTKILWEMSHGQSPSIDWSRLAQDLRTRGATVTESQSRVTGQLLDDYDIVWTVDSWVAWGGDEIEALRNWLAAGGSLLIEADESGWTYGAILVGSGLAYGGTRALTGVTTNIYTHPTTKNVNSILLGNPLDGLSPVDAPAVKLVEDVAHYATGAATTFGGGRIVVMTDEVFGNWDIDSENNRLLGNQVFDWLSGAGWLSVNPSSGVTAAGEVDTLTVAFDATTTSPGPHRADVVVSSNDPANPNAAVHALLNSVAAPNIAVADTAFDFGTVFIGQTETRPLTISNTGFDDLIVSDFASDDPDYSVALDTLIVPAKSVRVVDIAFAPTREDSIPATLTITNNDPDEPIVTVSLTGKGLTPPVMVISPDSLAVALFSGETAQRSMYVENTGGSDLNWTLQPIPIEASGSRTYTLEATESNADQPDRVKSVSPPRLVRSGPVEASLQDLTGVSVMWERAHGQSGSSGWSTIIADLTARGATVTENSLPITPALLAGYQVVWATDSYGHGWSGAEISALQAWMNKGGGLLIESDETEDDYNAILNGTGLALSYTSVVSGSTTNIYPHETTENVNTVSIGGPLASVGTIDAPAFKLVDDASGIRTGAAAAPYGAGRVALFSDEFFHNTATSRDDNRLFGNQVVDWLSGTSWLSVTPNSGTTAAGEVDTLTVTFDATVIEPGEYEADIEMSGNDPVTSVATTKALLDVTGVPDIAVSDSLLEFGTVMVGNSRTLNLTVFNHGNDSLVVSSVAADDAAFSTLVATPFTVGPGLTRIVPVVFAPGAQGPYDATLAIESNDYDEGTVTVELIGDGIDPPQITVLPDSLAEALDVGEFALHFFTIYNRAGAGASTLNCSIQLLPAASPPAEDGGETAPRIDGKTTKVGPIAGAAGVRRPGVVDGDDRTDEEDAVYLPWLVVSETSGSIGPGDSLVVEALFDARSIFDGTHEGVIRITTNVPANPVVDIRATLVATGVPVISVSVTQLDYGTIFAGYPSSKNLTVTNVGSRELSVNGFSADQPGFTASPDSFVLAPQAGRVVTVSYLPPAPGMVMATLTVASNDTTQASPEIDLRAAVVEAPVIAVSPESLFVAIDRGDTLTETVTVSNTGGSPLDWTAVLSTVSSPGSPATAVPIEVPELSNESGDIPEDVWNELLRSGRRPVVTDELRSVIGRQPQDLDGMMVLWHGDHYHGGIGAWSLLISDITIHGAQVIQHFSTITPALLTGYDVLWLGDRSTGLTAAEMQAIRDWAMSGGSVLIESDNNVGASTYHTLLDTMGTGIAFSTTNATSGMTSNIHPHQATWGVGEIFLPSPISRLYVSAPGGKLVDDVAGVTVAAFSVVGDGRVAAISEQAFNDSYIIWADNRLFGNQLFRWFSGVSWLTLAPWHGTLGAGVGVDLTLTVDGAMATPGTYDMEMVFSTNDPATPLKTIPLQIVVDEVIISTVDLDLDTGLNLRSWNVDTDVDSVGTILGPIVDKLKNARGFDGGGLVFDPTLPPQFNTLIKMDHMHGYWIQTTETALLQVTGRLVDHQTPMPLSGGYNLISYLPQYADSVTHALGGIWDKVQIVLGYDGGGLTHDPNVPPGFNTLQKMKPGYGYWVRLSEPATLVYPLNPLRDKNEGIVAAGDKTETLATDRVATRSREWISVWGDGIIVDGQPLPGGTVVTALDPDGVVCGEFEVTREADFGLMAIYGDDPETEIDEGAETGDAITIVLGDLGVFEGVRWTAMGDVVRFNEVASQVSETADQLPTAYALHQNHPNPFNPATTISYDLREAQDVQVTIYNIQGERVKELVNRHQGAGRYRVRWDGDNSAGHRVASGVYFCKLIAGDFVQTRKMLLLK